MPTLASAHPSVRKLPAAAQQNWITGQFDIVPEQLELALPASDDVVLLERIQFSAFFGKLNRNRRQELSLQLQRELAKQSARIRIVPICENDLKDMWVFDQYRLDADELKREAGGEKPRLRVLGQEEV